MSKFELKHGDCVAVLKTMDDASVDSIVTDPPYELGFMGKSWDSTGIAYSVELWQECLRVLKPGGHLLAFSGSRTYHRMAVAIEDAGFQIRDQIMWLYGSGFPKSLDVSKAIDKAAGAEREVVGTRTAPDIRGGNLNATVTNPTYEIDITAPSTPEAKQWQGWGTALKPAHEPIVVARKPIIGTIAANVLEHGTGGLNIDGSRVGNKRNFTQVQGSYSGSDVSIAGARDGGKIYPESLGRWPANVIHDGSDEVVELFPITKGGTWNKTSGARHFNNNGEPTGFETSKQDNTIGSAARFFYCAKASKRDRNEGLDDFEGKQVGNKGNGLARTCATCDASVLDGCGCPDRTFINPTRKNHHPTVKPTDLMRYLVKLVTPPNGTILDPFTGSGSTGKGAMLEDFNFIGIEQDADYIEIARARIQYVLDQNIQLELTKRYAKADD